VVPGNGVASVGALAPWPMPWARITTNGWSNGAGISNPAGSLATLRRQVVPSYLTVMDVGVHSAMSISPDAGHAP
jgi:hypothetical protein